MITYFHRNLRAGFSINKVTQTVISNIKEKQEYYVPYVNISITSLLKNILYIYKRRNRSCINHITGDIYYGVLALLGLNSVLTFHDTVSIDYRPMNSVKKKLIELLWYKIPLCLSKHVVCISNETKRRICAYTDRTDIKVIYNAVDPLFVTKPKDQEPQPRNILFIGTSANKNLENTILALKDIKCTVTIIGKLTNEQVHFLKDQNVDYINRFCLSDKEIVAEYEACDIVSFVSFFEGFGMPIVEANKVGRPVITSIIPVLKEVAGDAAIFVNPHDIDDIHNGFVRLFSDCELRKSCVQKGLENVRRFEVDIILNEWNLFYDQISTN